MVLAFVMVNDTANSAVSWFQSGECRLGVIPATKKSERKSELRLPK